MKLLIAGVPLALLLTACATGPASDRPLTSAVIAQGGQDLRVFSTRDGVYEYHLQKGPFSLWVPNHAGGKLQDASHIHIQLCASADPTIFQDINPGRKVGEMRCLNAAPLARSTTETPAGVDLILSKGDGQDVIDGKLSVSGPLYDTVNVRAVMDYRVVGKFCMDPAQTRCIDEHAMQPFGTGTVYLIVFTDLNGDQTVEAGEYTLLKLDIAG